MRGLLCVAVFVAAAAISTPAQTFKSGVDVVRVDALVQDGRQPIPGLTAADFELRDNGVLQKIDDVWLEKLPLSVVFALDTSASVSGSKLEHLRKGVDTVLDGLHGEDTAGLLTFSHRIQIVRRLSADRAAVHDAVHDATARGATALRDAVYAALAVTGDDRARSLVLAFSDGIDNVSWLSEEMVEHAAARADAVVYGVAVADRPATQGAKAVYAPRQTEFLEKVASVTGGRVIRADAPDQVSRAFSEVLTEFRTRYLIVYSPQGVATPGWHRIDLKVKGRAASISARRGYQR